MDSKFYFAFVFSLCLCLVTSATIWRTDPRACTANEFTCASGTGCVPLAWRCDGEIDCPDGSDEVTSVCANNTWDAEDQFACVHNGIMRCLPISYQCGDVLDCPDGSDEDDCCSVACGADSFRCRADNTCIPLRWECDSNCECSDGSDEAGNCSTEAECPSEPIDNMCFDGELMCADRSDCIHPDWWCDGDIDCRDGSDENEFEDDT